MTIRSDRRRAAVQVQLTDAPAVFNEVNIVITEVAVHQSGSDSTAWETLRTDSTTVDLLTLQNGAIRQLAAANVPSGHYTQLRLLRRYGIHRVDRRRGAPADHPERMPERHQGDRQLRRVPRAEPPT
jgi:hypothetical protein